MSDTQLQFKFLDAGAKSSVVVLDPSLSTCNEQTLYLYNQQRDQIIEYRRDIVEAKLRDLSTEEAKTSSSLQQAYETTRATFTPRGAAIQQIPEHAPEPKVTIEPVEVSAIVDFDDDDDIDTDD